MSYGHVDDQLHNHPKVHAAGLEAMGLWALALSHSKGYVTLGHVTRETVTRLAGSDVDGDRLSQRLVTSGLWHVTPNGFVFHDWLEHQTDDKIVKTLRKAATERKRKSRDRSRVTLGVTPPVTSGVTGAGHTGPVTRDNTRDLAGARVPNPKTNTNPRQTEDRPVGQSVVAETVEPPPTDAELERMASLTDREHGDGTDWEQECLRLQTESGGRLRTICGPVQAMAFGAHMRTLARLHKRTSAELVTILAAHGKSGLAFEWMTEKKPTAGYLLRNGAEALTEAVDLALQWFVTKGPEKPPPLPEPPKPPAQRLATREEKLAAFRRPIRPAPAPSAPPTGDAT